MNQTTNEDRPEVTPQQAQIVAEHPSHTRLALKSGGHFLVLDETGMMPNVASGGYGLYFDDTRYLSRWELSLNGRALRLLRSEIGAGYQASFIYGNNDIKDSQGKVTLGEQTVFVGRTVVVEGERVHERIRLVNYGVAPAQLALRLDMDADFVDMFEVRGSTRPRRGSKEQTIIREKNSSITYSYLGLDEVMMRTRVDFQSVLPTQLEDWGALFEVTIAPHSDVSIDMAISTVCYPSTRQLMITRAPDFSQAACSAGKAYKSFRSDGATITTSHAELNALLERAYRDLYILRQPTPKGNCLAAGIPWFTVAFGRDQCVTGLQSLPFLPQLTREIISVLAAYQGTIDEAYTAQEVGKIMHELRLGEMARLREIPFVPYYGTVDATQLWLMLLCRYVKWTGDKRFARKLWKNVRLAVGYLHKASASGYITYGAVASALSNQGWKDSGDSVMHSDGTLAKAPIAICEAQGYLYAAYEGLCELATQLGKTRQARTFARRARTLKKRFNRDFWMPEKNFIALALDGEGKQCDVIASNAGHLLDSCILDRDKAQAVARRLGEADMFCGWGIRTLSSTEARYNPMSYHNGSVWPHDNAIALAGLHKTGHAPLAHKVLQGMLDAARAEPELRLPELFCGFAREAGQSGPIRYPVSCVPQAWAAGSMFMMLAACLGIEPDAYKGELRIVRPSLPSWLANVTVSNLRIGNASVSLHFAATTDGGTACRVVSQTGALQVLVQR